MKYTKKQLKGLVIRLYREYVTYCAMHGLLKDKTELHLRFKQHYSTLHMLDKPSTISVKTHRKIELTIYNYYKYKSVPKLPICIKDACAIDNLLCNIGLIDSKDLTSVLRRYEPDIEIVRYSSDRSLPNSLQYLDITRKQNSLSAIDADKLVLDNLNNCLFIDLEWYIKNA